MSTTTKEENYDITAKATDPVDQDAVAAGETQSPYVFYLSYLVYFSFGFQIMIVFPIMMPVVEHFIVHEQGRLYFEDNKGKLTQTLFGGWYFVNAIASPFWGWCADRYGRRFVLMCGLLGAITSMTICGTATTYFQFLVGRIISGFADSTPFIAKTVSNNITFG